MGMRVAGPGYARGSLGGCPAASCAAEVAIPLPIAAAAASASRVSPVAPAQPAGTVTGMEHCQEQEQHQVARRVWTPDSQHRLDSACQAEENADE